MYQYWLHDEEKTSSCNHSVQKSSASTLPWFIYKPIGYRSLDNQPITAKFSKIPLYWHSSFGWNSHILANEIAWLQIIGKGNAHLSEQSWGGNMSQLKLELIPFLSFSAGQRYFYWTIERRNAWTTLIRFLSSACNCRRYVLTYGMALKDLRS